MSNTFLTGVLLDEQCVVTMNELCNACQVDAEWVRNLVEEGVLEPADQTQEMLYFSGSDLNRVRTVKNLQSDLGVNIAGAALALELLSELTVLRKQLSILYSNQFYL